MPSTQCVQPLLLHISAIGILTHPILRIVSQCVHIQLRYAHQQSLTTLSAPSFATRIHHFPHNSHHMHKDHMEVNNLQPRSIPGKLPNHNNYMVSAYFDQCVQSSKMHDCNN